MTNNKEMIDKLGLTLKPTAIGEKIKGSLFYYSGRIGLYLNDSTGRGEKVSVLINSNKDNLYIDGSLYTITTTLPQYKLISNGNEITLDEFGFHYDFYGVELKTSNIKQLCAEYLSEKLQQSNDISTDVIFDELTDFEPSTETTSSEYFPQLRETMVYPTMSERGRITVQPSQPTRNDTSSDSNRVLVESMQQRMYRREADEIREREIARMINETIAFETA